MSYKILFTLYALIFSFFCTSQEESWDFKNYHQYTYQSFITSAWAKRKIPTEKPDLYLLDAAIFYHANRVRAAESLPLFTHSLALEKAALEHSKAMIEYDFFDHQSPISGLETHVKRLEQVGVPHLASAENLFLKHAQKGADTYGEIGKAVVEGWLNSPKHRHNLLNERYRYMACGARVFENPEYPDYHGFKITQVLSATDSRFENFKY